MANYPQLDNASGVWNLREVYDAVMGGYWPNANNKAIFAGGFNPGYSSTIENFSMSSSGNSTFFGDLSIGRGEFGAMSNFTRCIFAGGNSVPGDNVATMDYVQFATEGNAADFGDLGAATQRSTGVGGNATRGIIIEGSSDTNQIQYITPSALGNAIDFGDRTVSGTFVAGVTSPTRTCFGGAFTPSVSNIIDFVTIATTGNATDFGDLTSARRAAFGCSSSTRGVFMGGITPSALSDIQFITIASQGNAIDYGDLLTSNNKEGSATSNSVVGFAGGGNPAQNIIQNFTIATGGNSVDYGDLIAAVNSQAANSAAHGGLNDGYQGTRPLPFNEAGGDLGLYFGGEGASTSNRICEINISSTGNANDFSGVDVVAYDANGAGNKTRGIHYSGTGSSGTIQSARYVEFKTRGNFADFGDATATRQIVGCAANNTRLLAGGGATPSNVNTIDYITIGTLGNAADFGDLTAARKPLAASSSNTRAVWAGGNNPDPTNVMDYVTIATVGNATDFGDLSVARRNGASANSTTRIVFAGGRSNPSPATESNVIDYITTATTGNATDFGDLTSARLAARGVSNTTRGCFMGGLETPGGNVNIIDFVTIGSTGNASDFGDLITAVRGGGSASNGHGGLVGG